MTPPKANVMIDGLVAQLIKAGVDETDIAGALLTAASRLAVEHIGPERWALSLEKAVAALRAPDISQELQ